MIVLRNLVFYFLFYSGGVFYVLAALASLPFSRTLLRRVVAGWVGFHRDCVEVVLGIRVVIEGEATSDPVLYAIKHESFFEAIDSPRLFEYPVPFAKRELFAIPGWGIAARAYGCVPVVRDGGARALKSMVGEARKYAAKGRPLVLFPEGTRVPHGEQRRLQAGFAGIYKLIGLPVVPVAVDSGPLYHRLLKRPGTITYRFGEAVPPGLPRAEAEARVLEAINALNEQGRRVSDPPGRNRAARRPGPVR